MKDNQTWNFTYEGVAFRMIFRRRGYRDRQTKTRLFVWLPETDDDSVFDSLVKRDRGGDPSDEIKARRKAMRLLAKAAMAKLELPTGIRYSIHAGCSMCPCSPGFIAECDLGGDLYVQSVNAIEKAKREARKDEVRRAKQAVKDAEKALKKAERELAKAERKDAKVSRKEKAA